MKTFYFKLISFTLTLTLLLCFCFTDSVNITNAELVNTHSVLSSEDDDEIENNEDLRYIEYINVIFPEAEISDEVDQQGFITVTFSAITDAFTDIDAYYECVFSEKDMTLSLNADTESCHRELITDVFIGNEGQLDATVSEHNDDYQISTLKEGSALGDFLEMHGVLDEVYDNLYSDKGDVSIQGIGTFFLAFAIVVVAYVIVAQTAEQIRAESNKTYNERLDAGVTTGYIYSQNNTSVKSFRYGFADIGNCGCGVISVYNLLVALGQREKLSQVIYNFEKWAIMTAVGWGFLGSQPREIYRYLNRISVDGRPLRYNKHLTFKSLNDTLSLGEHHYNLIISTWNKDTLGIHIYYINYDDGYSYNAYGKFDSLEDMINTETRGYCYGFSIIF